MCHQSVRGSSWLWLWLWLWLGSQLKKMTLARWITIDFEEGGRASNEVEDRDRDSDGTECEHQIPSHTVIAPSIAA